MGSERLRTTSITWRSTGSSLMESEESWLTERVRHIAPAFLTEGRLREARRHGSGHIHESLVVTFETNGSPIRYFFQRMNSYVFRDIPGMMENIRRVTTHLAWVRRDHPNGNRQLRLVPARDGGVFFKDEDGEFWRVYFYIEGTRSFDQIESPAQAFKGARAFGGFLRDLSMLPGAPLYETIPGFHDTGTRLSSLESAIEADRCSRAHECRTAIEFARERRWMASQILDLIHTGKVPLRPTHNDTKINNVLFDAKTGNAVAVVDLDTVMPGAWLHDFGDMARSVAHSAAEDERDFTKAALRYDVFEAIVRGYASEVGSVWNEAEWANLVFAAKVLAYELGVRFLTDHLEGDTYFKAAHPGQNLQRCLLQFELLRRMEESQPRLQEIVNRIRDEFHCGELR